MPPLLDRIEISIPGYGGTLGGDNTGLEPSMPFAFICSIFLS